MFDEAMAEIAALLPRLEALGPDVTWQFGRDPAYRGGKVFVGITGPTVPKHLSRISALSKHEYSFAKAGEAALRRYARSLEGGKPDV